MIFQQSQIPLRTYVSQFRKVELEILKLKPLIGLLIVGNLLGAFIGFFYYFEIIGLAQYSLILWILISDCPTAVLLLLGVYIQFEHQRFSNYNFFAFVTQNV